MHIPVLGAITTASRAVWNKLRGRPTVQADHGAIAAGGNQIINAPVATSGGTIATGQATIVTSPTGGPTIIVQPGATADFAIYVDNLPNAPAPTRDHFLEGQRLQEADRHDEAIKEFQAAFADADTDSQRGALHLLLGISQSILGRPSQAEGSFQEALRIFQPAGDREGESAALSSLGVVYGQRGELDKAEEHFEKALEIHRDIGNRLGEAQDLGNLSNVYADRGDLDKAVEQFNLILDIHREIGDRLGEAQDLGNLGVIYLQRGDLEKAKEYLQQAQAIYREIGAGGEGPEKVRQALERIVELEREQQERGE